MAEVVPYTSLFANQSAIVTSNDILSTVETSNNRIAEVNTNTYVLQTASNAAISDKLGIPAWLADAISNSIVEGEVDIRQVITDLDTALRSLVTGVSQQISSVQTEVESNNTLLTGTVSRLDDDIAGVITLANSKVTPEQATATIAAFLEAEFNTPTVIANSTILNLLNTTSDATGTLATSITNLESSFSQSNTDLQITIDANASITDTRLTTAGIGSDGLLLAGAYTGQNLVAAVGDVEARLTTEESVSVGTHIWDAVEPLRIGMKQYVDPDVLPTPNILGNVRTYMGGIIGWVLDTHLDSSVALTAISNLENSTGVSLAALQSQIDGEISNWFYTGVPTNLVEPESLWVAEDIVNGNDIVKTNHLGDLYYDGDTGVAYRYSAGWVWTVITDTAITLALTNASNAQDTADGKRTIYYLATPPTVGVDIGDMNVHPTTKIVTMWNGTAWADTTNTTAETAKSWAGGASSMLVNPATGAITGWNYADGSTGQSTFGIAANSFFIENSSIPGYKPFTVDGTNVLFNGKVSFTNVTGTSNLALTDMSNVTTIDGGKITTGTIDAARIFTDEIIMQTAYSGVIKSANYVDGVSGMKVDFKNGSIYIA